MKKYVKCTIIVVIAVILSLSVAQSHNKQKEQIYTQRSSDMVKIWKTALDYYGYWDVIWGNENWNASLPAFQERLWECKDDYDYYLLLREMTAQLQDGHGGIFASNDFLAENGEGYLPFLVQYVEGNYIVTSRTGDCPLPLLANLTHINGKEIGLWLEEEKGRYVGLQNALSRKSELGKELVRSRKGESIEITYRDENEKEYTEKLKYTALKGNLEEERILLQTADKLIYEGEYVELYENEGIHRMTISFFNQKAMEEFQESVLPALADSRGVILDLRVCNGMNTSIGSEIVETLSGKELKNLHEAYSLKNGFEMRAAKQMENAVEGMNVYEGSSVMERGKAMINGTYYYNTSSPDAYSKELLDYIIKEVAEIEDGAGQENPETGVRLSLPCLILTDMQTDCAAEEVILVAKEAGIPIMGQNTAGKCGGVILEELSNGWSFQMTASNTYGPNGEQLWINGVTPDIPVEPTVADYRQGIDRILIEGIAYIKKNR